MSSFAIDELQLTGAFTVGRVVVTHLSDGVVIEPRQSWFTGVEPECWMPAVGIQSPDTPIPVNFGGFLVQDADTTTLFDCGIGANADTLFPGIREGGRLLERLGELGVTPGDVNRLVISHLHIDHCGHLVAADGSPTFPRAEVWLHDRELDYWSSIRSDDNIQPAEIRKYLESLAEAGVLRTYTDEFVLSEGIRLIPSEGHTPGHTVLLIESDGAYGMLLGDVVHHRSHFEHPDWLQKYDVEPSKSVRTRVELFDRAADLGAIVTAVHMPILTLGTVTATGRGAYTYHPIEPREVGAAGAYDTSQKS